MKYNLRTITALLPKATKKYINSKHFFYNLRNFLFLFLVLLAGVLLQVLVMLQNKVVVAKNSYSERSKEYTYWSSVASQFPTIPDVLYNAAISSYNMGDREQAVQYLEQALHIDPLFKKAQEFKKELGE